MSPPFRATYRLQLRDGVDFAAAAESVPYLARLGISHLYLPPVTRARSGSTHGYDVVDPNEPDPALGGAAGWARLIEVAQAHGLGLLLDIVPNHMAASTENPWWRSVLEEGRASPHAGFFDIGWGADAEHPRPIELPILGAPLEEVLEQGQLELQAPPDKGVELVYFDHRLPLAPASYALIDPGLHDLLRSSPRDEGRIATALGAASKRDRLWAILEAQHYRLVHWREVARHLSYRRFFDIVDLAGLRMEEPEVFEAGHRWVRELVAAGAIQGLRLDHIDGLADPAGYLRRLQDLLREEGLSRDAFLVLVEKILGRDEQIPSSWPVDGTTGYEVLNALLDLMVDPAGVVALERLWQDWTGDARSFQDIVAEAKRQILAELFPVEARNLTADAIAALGLAEDAAEALGRAIRALLMGFDVYRTYVDRSGPSAADRVTLARARVRALELDPGLDAQMLDGLIGLFEAEDERALRFALRFQQLSGPLMAKSLEDTAFYRWFPLLARNEVGGEPGHPPACVGAFHHANAERRRLLPRSMIATATHDTKRGEDVRARLAVLSEIPDIWDAASRRWRDLAAAARSTTPGNPAPDPATEYLLLQTLVGCWPIGLEPRDGAGLAALADRLVGYAIKATREAKLQTSWTRPDAAFEAAVERYLRTLLDPVAGAALLADLAPFASRIARAGVVNSLAQTLLKLTIPGLPDIYQGTEGWDLSLVDPDNRRKVDYAALLAGLEDERTLPERLADWTSGRVKQGLVARVLKLRAARPELFAQGSYDPLEVEGPEQGHLVAFARSLGEQALVIVVPRLVADRIPEEGPPLPDPARWGRATLALPRHDLPWRDWLVETAPAMPAGRRVPVADLLGRFPAALLVSGTGG